MTGRGTSGRGGTNGGLEAWRGTIYSRDGGGDACSVWESDLTSGISYLGH